MDRYSDLYYCVARLDEEVVAVSLADCEVRIASGF